MPDETEIAVVTLDSDRIHAVLRRQLKLHLFNTEEECPCNPWRAQGTHVTVHNYIRPDAIVE